MKSNNNNNNNNLIFFIKAKVSFYLIEGNHPENKRRLKNHKKEKKPILLYHIIFSILFNCFLSWYDSEITYIEKKKLFIYPVFIIVNKSSNYSRRVFFF